MKRIETTNQATKIWVISDVINDIVGGFSILEGWNYHRNQCRKCSKYCI